LHGIEIVLVFQAITVKLRNKRLPQLVVSLFKIPKVLSDNFYIIGDHDCKEEPRPVEQVLSAVTVICGNRGVLLGNSIPCSQSLGGQDSKIWPPSSMPYTASC
jgi:hypothetical protein